MLLLALLFASCNYNDDPQVEYDAVAVRANSHEAQNDSLQFKMQGLILHNDYLEKALDTLQQGFSQR